MEVCWLLSYAQMDLKIGYPKNQVIASYDISLQHIFIYLLINRLNSAIHKIGIFFDWSNKCLINIPDV